MAETTSQELNIKIKLGSDKNLDFKIQTSWTVLQLKEEIQKVNEAKPTDMKLIFKGRILKDADPLSNYKITEGATMHLVVSKPPPASTTSQQSTQQQSQPQQNQQQQQPQQNNNVPPNMAAGAGLPGMAGLGGMDLGALGGGGMDPAQLQGMLNNPMVQQMMNNLMQNPQMMQNLIQSNPMLSQMMENNPEMQQLMQNPEMMQNAMNMLGNNPNLAGGLGGGLGGLGGLGGAGTGSGAGAQTGAQSGAQPGTGAQGAQGGAQQPDLLSMLQNNPMLQGLDLGALGLGAGLGGGLGGQQPGQQDNTPPEEKFKDQLVQMEAMGFTNKEVNIQALQATQGNVEAAVERVLNMIG